MTDVQVSVIMAVYNGSSTLERSVGSIIDQSFRDWELVVVDDGSSDDTPLILARMAKADQRIKVHSNSSNLGIGASLNVAWRKSACDLIARMDADDVSLRHRLERQVEFMADHPDVSILGTAVELVDRSGNGLGLEYRPENHNDIVARLFHEIPVFHPTVMMRRHFLAAMGGYDERLRRAEDLDLWLRSYRRFRFHNLREVHLRYRVPAKCSWSELLERTLVLVKAAGWDRDAIVHWWYIARFFVAGLLAFVGLRSDRRSRLRQAYANKGEDASGHST